MERPSIGDIINGPPTPPPGYDVERMPVEIFAQSARTVANIPGYSRVFGCSAVSAAMVAGYYDRSGYPNMYNGPTDGGLAPLTDSSWSNWTDGNKVYPNNPLVASHNGLDGRATRGFIDDYWVQYFSTQQDPFITNGWFEHGWGDAIGDYMMTSQSNFGNTDGSTTFWILVRRQN